MDTLSPRGDGGSNASEGVDRGCSDPTKAALIEVLQADGWVLVTRSRDMRKVLPPYKFFYEHSQHEHLETALEDFKDYSSGEYPGREAVCIYPVLQGRPFGPPIPDDLLPNRRKGYCA